MVDADPQGSLTIYAGADPRALEKEEKTLYWGLGQTARRDRYSGTTRQASAASFKHPSGKRGTAIGFRVGFSIRVANEARADARPTLELMPDTPGVQNYYQLADYVLASYGS